MSMELDNSFKPIAAYSFDAGAFYEWQFGMGKLNEQDVPVIAMVPYSGNLTDYLLDNYDVELEGVELLRPEGSGRAYVVGNLPAYLRELDDNFAMRGIKVLFLQHAEALGYSEEDCEGIISESQMRARAAFAGPSEALTPGDGYK